MSSLGGTRNGTLNDFNEVWEIRALKRKPRADEAQAMLERVARQVRPIMKKRGWRVVKLSEFCPSNKRLLGINVNRGREIRIRLRHPSDDLSFFPFEHVLGTMLHELAHMARGPHDSQFYAVLDELTRECEDVMVKEMTGQASSEQAFLGDSHRLGGIQGRSTAKAAAAAAADRRRTNLVRPGGPQKLGGDRSLMRALTPGQAAAMAAERRMRDNAWCGEEWEKSATDGDTEVEGTSGAQGHEQQLGAHRGQGGSLGGTRHAMEASTHPCRPTQLRAAGSSGVPQRPLVAASVEGLKGRGRNAGLGGMQDLSTSDRLMDGCDRAMLQGFPSGSRKRQVCEGGARPEAKRMAGPGVDIGVGVGTASPGAAHEGIVMGTESDCRSGSVGGSMLKGEDLASWSCTTCTFRNLAVQECEMCGTWRPSSGALTGKQAIPGENYASQECGEEGDNTVEGHGVSEGHGWSCHSCMLLNDQARTTCLACETPQVLVLS